MRSLCKVFFFFNEAIVNPYNIDIEDGSWECPCKYGEVGQQLKECMDESHYT